MITARHVFNKKNEIISAEYPTHEQIGEYLKWMSDNYENMDDTGKHVVDWSYDNLAKGFQKILPTIKDSPNKRKALRSLASFDDEHVSIERLYGALRVAPINPTDIAVNWERHMLECGQLVLDFLFDIGRGKPDKPSELCCVSMLYGCVDELLPATHLAQYHYYLQANTHLRSIIEALDKVDLFLSQPEWFDVWAGDDDKKIRNELSPASVRQKLGRDRYDPLYGFLSELGPHATYKSLQQRLLQKVDEPKNAITIFVGGTNLAHLQMHTFQLGLIVSGMIVGKITKYFSDYLELQECEQRMDQQIQNMKEFNENFFVPFANENGLDSSHLTSHLDCWGDEPKE